MGCNEAGAEEGSTAFFHDSPEKEKVIFTGYVILVILLALIRLVVLDQVISWNWQLIALQENVSAMHRDNLLLKEQILYNASLSVLSAKARQRGFREAKEGTRL